MKYLIIEIPEKADPNVINDAIVNLAKNNSIKIVENELRFSKCNIQDFLNAIENSEIKDSNDVFIKSINKYEELYEEIRSKYLALERTYDRYGDFVVRVLKSHQEIIMNQSNFSQGLYDNISESIEFIKKAITEKQPDE